MKLKILYEVNQNSNIEDLYVDESHINTAIILFKKQMDYSDPAHVKILESMLKQKKEIIDKKSKFITWLDKLKESVKNIQLD